MKENLDLNQILFDELVEFPRKRLGISIREFCAEAHVGTATYSKVHGVWGRGAQGGV